MAEESGKEKKVSFGYEEVAEHDRQGRVNEIFTSVASKYDLMNDLMSGGVHRLWKRFVANKTGLRPGGRALDVAGGTADIAMLMAERVGAEGEVVVFDINHDMLKVGEARCIDKGFVKGIKFVRGNAEEIGFADNTFDCVTIGFGVRNVTHLDRAFSEMTRVARPGGRVICLEFSHPKNPAFKKVYDIYSANLIPMIGERITGNRDAYTYLHESIRKFPTQQKLKKIMEDAGLFNVRYYNLFGGIAAVHIGDKI